MSSSAEVERAISLDDLDGDGDDDFSSSHSGDGRRQFVAFEVLGEVYGIDIDHVIEIVHSVKVTRLPGTPPFIGGVISLRGAVLPIVDLEAKFTGRPGAYGPRSGIVVVQVGARRIGVRALRVTQLMSFRPDEIHPVPNISRKIRTEFLLGLAQSGDELLIALDVDRLLSEEELALVDAHASVRIDAQVS